MDFSKLYNRRELIEAIHFKKSLYTYVDYEDETSLLPYQVLCYLNKVTQGLTYFELYPNPYTVSPKLEEFVCLVNQVIQTQKIKQELFQRTIPDYKLPTIHEKMSECLGFNVSHISVRGLRMIERWFEQEYLEINADYFKDYIYIDYDKACSPYLFDNLTCTVNRTCMFKEELMAKVYHPDRMDKWVNYI